MGQDAVATGVVRDNSRSRWQRSFNRFVRWLLGSPVHWMMSGKLMVVEVVGRRTGARYSVPTAYADRGDQVLAASPGSWVRNLAPDRPVVLVHRGRRRTMVPRIVTDREAAGQVAADLFPGNPVLRRNMQVSLGRDGQVDHDQLAAALQRGVRLITFSPPA